MTPPKTNKTNNPKLPSSNFPLQTSHFLFYRAEDGTLKVDVRLEDETVWLTQPLMAELFQTSIPNISMHIRNIYEEGELVLESTVKKFLTVRKEGAREVQRELEYYNLDVIISVGYRPGDPRTTGKAGLGREGD